MRIFGTVDKLQFDNAGYTDAVRTALEKQFRRAARAFVRAALKKIPVETGMAAGSFLNIGRFLNIAVPITPTRFNKFYYHTAIKIRKIPESGAILTTPPNEIITVDGDKIKFQIQSNVFHLNLQDTFAFGSGPWGSFEAGRDAFMREMAKFKVPNIKSFVTKTTITFGKGSLIISPPKRLRKQETIRG